MSRKLLITLLLSVPPLAPAGAIDLGCAPTTLPYLQILGYRSIVDVGILPPNTLEERSGSLLCRDRRTNWVLLGSYPEDRQPASTGFLRGRVAPASWSEITSAAQAARIGLVKSCQLRAELLGSESYHGQVTWYGAGARTNTFRLSSLDFSLPPCPAAVEMLWLAIQQRTLEPDADSFLIGDLALPIGR